jgi:hypothetical protein
MGVNTLLMRCLGGESLKPVSSIHCRQTKLPEMLLPDLAKLCLRAFQLHRRHRDERSSQQWMFVQARAILVKVEEGMDI